MRRLLATAAFALLALPGSALAGGWATAGVSSTPEGRDWDTEITIMQHGRTPLDGVQPAIVITDADGTETRFPAATTGKPGVYSVHVRFPATGRYTYTVDDGFGNAFPHEFPAVTIGATAGEPAPAAATPEDFPWLPVIAGSALAALLAAGAFVMARRRRSGPQTA
jgi:hypothetical protein